MMQIVMSIRAIAPPRIAICRRASNRSQGIPRIGNRRPLAVRMLGPIHCSAYRSRNPCKRLVGFPYSLQKCDAGTCLMRP